MTPSTDADPLAHILVVDDEPEIADMLVDILAPQGYTVETASDGEEALSKLIVHDFDVVLSDLIMPRMDGPSLYRALADARPVMVSRMVFITGDTLSPEAEMFLADAGRPVIEKPFIPPDVRATVKRVLTAAGR